MALNLGDLVGYIKFDDSQANSVLDGLPSKMQGSGAKMVGAVAIVGGLVGAALVSGVSDAMQFDATNDKVAASLGLTAVESARVGTLAGSVYAQNYGESVEQVQQTIGGVVTQIQGMGTASDKAVEGMTAKVLNYSSAFGGETSEAIQQVQQLIANGLAPDAEAAMDLMTTAMQKVPEALRGDMTDAISEYGPILAGMGFSGEQAFDVLAKGSEKGMYGIDKAGDALKEFSIRSTDMSKASGEAYDALGMNQEEMSAKLLAGGETGKQAFDTIVAGLNGMTDPVAQSQAALALFGTPLEDLGVTEIPKFLGSLTDLGGGFADTAGAADALGVTMGDNAAGKLEAFNRTLEIMGAELGEKLLPAITAVMDYFAASPEMLTLLLGVLGFLALAFVAITVATWAMNTALLANPLTWIILLIGLLVAAVIYLVMNWGEVWAQITAIWTDFASWFQGALDAFLGWWNGLWTAVWEFLVGVWVGFTTWVVATFQGFLGMMQGIGAAVAAWWNGLWSKVGSFLQFMWTSYVALVTSRFTALFAFASGVGAAIAAWWTGLWTTVGAFLTRMWTAYVATVTTIFTAVFKFLTATGAAISAWWSGMWSAVGAFLSKTWATLKSVVTTVFTAIFAFLTSTGAAIASWWNGLWSAVGSFLSGAWAGLQAIVTAAFTAIFSFLSATGAAIAAWWSGMWAGVSAFLASAWAGMLAIVSGIVGSISGFLQGAFSGIASFLAGIWSGVSSTVSSTWSGILSYLSGLPGQIMGAFGNMGSLLTSMGRDLIDGLLKGIKDMAGRVFDFIGGMAADIAGKFAGVLGIHSPSRVFKAFGVNTVEGYLEGIDDMRRDAELQMETLVQLPEVSSVGTRLAPSTSTTTTETRTYEYHAAENQSLTAEESLLVALGGPRAKGN